MLCHWPDRLFGAQGRKKCPMMHWTSSGYGHGRRLRWKRRRGFLWLSVTLLLMADVPRPNFRSADAALKGTLRIVGSRGLDEPVERWARAFQQSHPNVRVTTSLYGTGIAAGAMAEGRADVAPLHRALKPEERHYLSDAGISPVLVPISAPDHSPIYLYIRRTSTGDANPAALEFARVVLDPNGQGLPSRETGAAPSRSRLTSRSLCVSRQGTSDALNHPIPCRRGLIRGDCSGACC
jgi:ABC-type molybdate transport system substrate-binding protein